MKKKDLLAIERIISVINELNILTKGKDSNYFFDSLELNALIDLIYEIDQNINKISFDLKEKYSNINWSVVASEKDYDEVMGPSINVGTVWRLASNDLNDALMKKLNELLVKEIPEYYKDLCSK